MSAAKSGIGSFIAGHKHCKVLYIYILHLSYMVIVALTVLSTLMSVRWK